MAAINDYDSLIDEAGPAALVLRETLVPVEGPDGIFFPPTFAKSDDGDFPGGYNIDGDPRGENVCLVDSVGAQANRMEPLFGKENYATLVPQVTITAGDRKLSLLEAGHRAGDAIVRCTPLQEELRLAFRKLLNGDAEPLAKLAPTSLVFGVWDSRDTQAKAPRLIASAVRAFNVRKLTRSAQYVPAVEYVAENLVEEPTEKAAKDALAKQGFAHVPASASHGGVIAKGEIRRDAILSLAALRLLRTDDAKTTALRRYVFGLALTAFTANVSGYLRQGCSLVLSNPGARTVVEVYPDGTRKPFTVAHEQALAYAREVATAFGVGKGREVPFDKELAKADLTNGGKKKKGKAAAAKA